MSRRLILDQELAGSPSEVFPFFGDAFNLERITPAFLRFRVLTPEPIVMGVGTLIEYRLRLHGIPIRWRTRISAWEPPIRFVDEQVSGPYRRWVHEHTFEATHRGTTLARDVIDYAAPGGRVVERLLVDRDVDRIFDHRRRVLAGLFPLS